MNQVIATPISKAQKRADGSGREVVSGIQKKLLAFGKDMLYSYQGT
jgi:hypothetical protein